MNSSTGAITGTVYGQGSYVTQFVATDSLGTTATVKVKFSFAGDSTLGGCTLFPNDSIFHRKLSGLPVDTSPSAPVYPAYLGARMTAVLWKRAGWARTRTGFRLSVFRMISPLCR